LPHSTEALGSALADRYVIEKELGHGGMATVYLAHDLKHSRLVALKVLHAELAAAVGPERFLREIKVTARLDHPHILPVLASGDAAGLLWYTMPYVEGESLRDRLRRESQLSVDEALRIACEVADALDYSHSHGVVHRDVKPENILLAHGHARVADFGVARALEAAGGEKLTGTGLAIGTPLYMSPEQASGGQVDGRSDIYSLGCVLYEMVAGEPPFTGPTPQAVLVRRLTETPRPLGATRERLPAGLERVVTKALGRVPADRFQTAAKFNQALAQAGSTPASEARRVARPLASARQLFLLGAALLFLVAVTYLAGRHLARRGTGGPAPPARLASVAVLPFRNLGSDSREEYLSDGMTEDLINALGRTPELRVVARTSAFTFKGKAEDIRKVGAQLNVGAVVEGSFRKLGDTLRVTAQLVSVNDGYQLWSGRYDRPSADLLAIEDELTRAILRALSPRAAGALDTSRATSPTDSPEAYKLYLKGRYHLGKMTEGDYRNALKYFDEAIGLDPTFALAYTGLAGAYGALYGTFLPAAEGMPKAKAAALRALELDPNLAEAHGSLGGVQMMYEWDWRGAERSFRRAVELKPNDAGTHSSLGWLLIVLGRFGEAAGQLNQARQLDPLSLHVEVTAVWPLFYGRRYDEAIDALRKTVSADSSFVGAQFRLAEAYTLKGEFGQAQARWQAVRALIGDHSDVLGRLGYLYAVSGQRQKAYAIADTLRARYHKGLSDEPYDIAVVYTGLGETEKALGWLETAYEERSSWITFAKVSAELDPLRAEPRFRALLEKLGLN
jgi:TolB-like protein/Tfp pilus assembly protein PilF